MSRADRITRRTGRPPGALNRTSRQAREFAQMLVSSPAYRFSLIARIKAGTLPPAIETMIWHYAFGKPKETIELVDDREKDFSSTTTQDLAKRAELLAIVLRTGKQEVLETPEEYMREVASELETVDEDAIETMANTPGETLMLDEMPSPE